jgi:outer membrane protein OmpA-like peptidoglycan-associated protein
MANQQAIRADWSLKDKLPGLLAAGLIAMALGGCARQSIILVPDPEGRIGKAEVTTSAGKQLLEKPGDMTRTSGRSNPPSAVTTADPAFIAATFGEALAVEPPPPQTFTLLFETGTTALTAESLKSIADIVSASQRRSAISVSISGHTDTTGSDKLNDALALERAQLVKALLLRQGVKPELISVTSHGKGNPAIPTPDGVPEPRNRRAVVIIH